MFRSLPAVSLLCVVCSLIGPAKTATVCRASSECRILPSCTPIMDLLHLLDRPLKRPAVDFLRSQQCGFENGFPKVCCASLPRTIPIVTHNPKKVSINASTFTSYPDISQSSSSTQTFYTTTTTTKKPLSEQQSQEKIMDMENFFQDLSTFDIMLRTKRNSFIYKDIEIR